MVGFFLYKRNDTYYARLKNRVTGQWTVGKSTGKKDREEATFVVYGWLQNEIPQGRARTSRISDDFFAVDTLLYQLKKAPLDQIDITQVLDILKTRGFIEKAILKTESSQTFVEYLYSFWDYDNSSYIQDRKAHGKKITKTYCQNSISSIKNYWEPFFQDKGLVEITRKDLKDFSIYLSKQKNKIRGKKSKNSSELLLSASTKNNILKAGTVGLKWADLEKLIPENPAEGLSLFSGKAKKRDIPTNDEVENLFRNGDWGLNPTNKLANWTAMQTGLRQGEICSLRVSNIYPDHIFVEHSWSALEGEKPTKTNEVRRVAITPILYNSLIAHAKTNPHGYSKSSFVFYNTNSPDKPHDGKLLYRTLKKALESIGIDNETRIERGLTFHSWRHYFARHMVDVLDKRAAALTGHQTPEMLEQYADHAIAEDFESAKRAINQVFGGLSPISMGGMI